MDIVSAIRTAKVGQKVKRQKGTASFVKTAKDAILRLKAEDYKATDWVVSVPEKRKTIKTPNFIGEAKVLKGTYIAINI